jgi:metal-sulfur cluster biosynthetic enzyme
MKMYRDWCNSVFDPMLSFDEVNLCNSVFDPMLSFDEVNLY